MPRRTPDLIEVFKQKQSMSQSVQAKDPTFGDYAGANPEISFDIARIDVMLEAGLIPSPIVPFIKLRRMLLDRYRKAYFASTTSEVTVLGFLLGVTIEEIDALEDK